MSGPLNLDDLHGDTPVAFIGITLLRSGGMKMEGSITDEHFVQHMLTTAQAYMRNYHAQQKRGLRSSILVAANDTSLVGTREEKLLIGARDALSDAMAIHGTPEQIRARLLAR